MKLGQSFHVRQYQERIVAKSPVSVTLSEHCLIVEESQFLETNVGEHSPADVVPLDYSLVVH